MPILFAFIAALCFALGAVLQHRANRVVPHEHSMRFSLIVQLAKNPLWMLSLALDAGGYLMQAIALGKGAIVVVQLVIVSGMLLFALLLNAYLTRRHLTRRDWVGVLATLGGLALYLAVSAPRKGSERATVDDWIVVVVVCAILVGGLILAAGHKPGTRKAVLLAVATGIAFSLTAALTRTVVINFGTGIWPAVISLAAAGVVTVGLFGMLLENSAYQAGPLTAALPALIVSDPIAAAILGWILFHEHVHRMPFARVVAVVSGVVIVSGVVLLARSELVVPEEKTPDRAATRHG